MTKIAASYKASFTNGESRIFLAHSPNAAWSAAASWMHAFRSQGMFLKSVEAAGA